MSAGADRPIFLVGFMGSGKTEAGRALATRLGWELADTDAMVERAAGKSVEALFRDAGEGRFRELEWDALRGLDGRRRLVVATGGGLFLGVVQRAFMRERGATVWLDVPFAVALSRVGGAAGRPLWRSDDPVEFRAFFEKRRAAYALAEHVVAAGLASPDEIAGKIVNLVNAHSH